MTKQNEVLIIYLKTAAMVGSVLVVFLIWLWWVQVYTNPKNVFNGMLNGSLSIYGVTKTVEQKTAGASLKEVSQAQFGGQNIVETKSVVNQQINDGDANIVTRTIATPQENFVQYNKILMPKVKDKAPIDFTPILNKWGKQSNEEGGGGVFSSAVFGIILFGNLPKEKREEILELTQKNKVYSIDYDKVQSKNIDGKSAYVYPVEVNLEGYVKVLIKYDEMLGLGTSKQVDPKMYKEQPPIKVSLSIAKNSRELLEVKIEENKQSELFSGYGIRKSIDPPSNSVPRQQLELEMQKLLR